MARFLKSRFKAKGAAPGSLIFIGQRKMDLTKIRMIQYDSSEVYEKEYKTIDTALKHIKPDRINWLNIDGIHDADIVREVGRRLKISNLALEQVLNTGQRTKYFEDKDSITIITKPIYYDEKENEFSSEQISFVLLHNVLVTFQEKTGDHFEPVRQRIRNSIGHLRSSGSDYLLYTLIDSLVDNYLIHLEKVGDKIEKSEAAISNPTKELSNQLFHYKTEIAFFRKTIRPLKEVLTRLLRSKTELFDASNVVYYQELYDLTEQAIEAAENYFSMTNDLINNYNTNLSHKVNEVMKVLTIFASIFIPLTFIAGIYGTNFEYLPELQFKHAYFVMWGAMILVAGTMLYYFKKHNWF